LNSNAQQPKLDQAASANVFPIATALRRYDYGSSPLPNLLRHLPMSDVSRILSAIEHGEAHRAEELLPLVYAELRKLAAQKLAYERPGQTLQATALVHEAYLRLVEGAQPQSFNTRGHFFAAAAEAMRRILVEHARRKKSLKRGGAQERVRLDAAVLVSEIPSDDLLALDEALEKFAKEDAKKAELVKLRYFAGLSVQEAADLLGISRATADRYWAYAKVWLYREVHGGSS
jgi:RNA polymerase sigma factor (TIGR02999 family)